LLRGEAESALEVGKHLMNHVFMNKEKSMRSSIERVGNFSFSRIRIDYVVYDMDDLARKGVEIEDGWVRVKANCMELITILNIE
jgi:hypothetical protein